MIDELVLHVGVHKTATTFLQQSCWHNRARLAAQGLLYPEVGILDGAHHHLGGTLIHGLGKSVFGARRQLKFERIDDISYWQALAAALRSATQPLALVSTEEFEWLAEPAVVRDFLRAQLPGVAIRVVLYLRRQDRYLESLYQQMVRDYAMRVHQPFAQWWQHHDPSIVHFDRLVARWADAFGDDSLRLRLFDDERGANLLHGFLGAVGAEPSLPGSLAIQADNPLVRSKSGMDSRCIEFLRMCNKAPLDRDRHQRLVDALYDVHAALAGKDKPALALIEPEHRRELLASVAEGNERLRARWFPARPALFDAPGPDESGRPNLTVRDVVPELARTGLI